jgi:chromate transport protein ChrA
VAQFLPGYTVTSAGSLLGLFYGLTVGFLVGWGFALLRNAALFLSLAVLRRRAQLRLLKRFLEFV